MSLYQLSESTNRYSVEVNYRTTMDEVEDGFAQLVIGYVSAAMKKANYHTKMMFDEKPYRLIISARKWQEGEWVQVLSWSQKHHSFMISKGFYHKATSNVMIQSSKSCDGISASEIYKELMRSMDGIKDEKPHHNEYKPVKNPSGPVKGSMRPAQGMLNKGKL